MSGPRKPAASGLAEIEAGMTLPALPCLVTPELQRNYLEPAEVAPELYGEWVDLSVLANQCLKATRPLREGRAAGLHMGHRMTQCEPVRLGEPLTIFGIVAETAAMATGTRIRVDLEFRRADGSVPVRGATINLRVDREAMRRRGERAAKPFDSEGYRRAAAKHMTPERVMGYSREFPEDKVHFDLAVAHSIGFRVPVAQGLMSLTWMTAALAERGLPRELDIAAEFRRPIFWDDAIAVLARDETAFRILNAEGQVCSLGRVAHLVRD